MYTKKKKKIQPHGKSTHSKAGFVSVLHNRFFFGSRFFVHISLPRLIYKIDPLVFLFPTLKFCGCGWLDNWLPR